MRETSLDEFVGEDESTPDEATDGPETPAAVEAEGGSADTSTDPEAARDDTADPPTPEETARDDTADPPTPEEETQPAVSTFEWTPDGRACARCAETVTRRWRDDGELVCSSCKTW